MPADRSREELWSRRDIAEYTGVGLRTLQNWGYQRDDFPAAVAVRANAKLYRADDVRRWWADQQIDDSDERWSLRRAAAELDVNEETLRTARSRGHTPEPDGWVRRRPWWSPATLRRWVADRTPPEGAWLRADVARHLGRARLSSPPWPPPPDGQSVRGGWWWPQTIRDWQDQLQQARRAAAEARLTPKLERAPDQLYGKDVAELTGLSWDSIRTYRRKGLMPEPDGWHGHRPWWTQKTVLAWDAARAESAGRGGRPRRAQSTDPPAELNPWTAPEQPV